MRIKSLLGLFALLSTLSQISAAVDNTTSVDASESAKLVIFRTSDKSAVNYRFDLDQEHLGKIEKHGIVERELKLGEHRISANDKANSELIFELTKGKTHYVKINLTRKSKLTLEIVDESDDYVKANLMNLSDRSLAGN